MPHFYFDTRDRNRRIVDNIGEYVSDLARAQVVAAASLAELARDVLPGSTSRCLAVDVRDITGLVLTTKLTYHAHRLQDPYRPVRFVRRV
jgi:hypothetical protein